MPNFNDAKITSLYVSEEGAVQDIEDEAPNSPAGGKFRVTVEMVAGEGVLGDYDLITTCADLTETAAAPALNPGAPLNAASAHFQQVPWVHDGLHWVFNQSAAIAPPKISGHVYRYTAALHNSNGQIVSLRQSEPFTLLA
jgi:hypothetical protein